MIDGIACAPPSPGWIDSNGVLLCDSYAMRQVDVAEELGVSQAHLTGRKAHSGQSEEFLTR